MPPRLPVPFLRVISRQGVRPYTTTKMEPSFSKGSDVNRLKQEVDPLLSANGGRWSLTNNGEALERTFDFKTFTKTWDFMTAVSLMCKVNNHHPEWSNVYSTTFIRWTTHSPKGLSAKDVDLATRCDALANDFGVLDEPTTTSCEMKGLADQVVSSSGDCCTPKSKK